MRQHSANPQRGVALLAFVAVIGIVATWFLVKQLNLESGGLDAARKQRTAEVLSEAKRALIGYVAHQAAVSGEENPGAFPCPEAPAGYDSTTGTDGRTQTPSCNPLPAVGRFPWRTIGTDKLVDAYGEPLWYVVASGWSKPSSTGNTVINSDCASASTLTCWTGQLTVDGQPNAAVALIIAPGRAMNTAAGTGCPTAVNQVRPVTGPPNLANWLECENATSLADANFVTTGPSGSFNDQVITITAAEILPAIEAAIADRIEREVVPLLNSAYAAPSWGLTGSDKVYPYAAPFANPDTSSFTGTAGTNKGLLPLVHTETTPGSGTACTSGVADPRCNSDLVVWSNASPTASYTNMVLPITSACSYASPTGFATCNGTYVGVGAAPRITVSGPQSNGAMSLRATNSNTGWVFYLDLTNFSFTQSQPLPSVRLNNDGTFTVSITATPPAPLGLAGGMYWIFVPGNATSDHSLLDSSTASSTGWFLRNNWHKLTHYAVAPGYTAVTAAPRSCTTVGTCLSVSNLTPSGAQRAILLLAGRSINGAARPSSTLADYLEFGNVSGAYERHSVTYATTAAYPDTGGANAYVVAATTVAAGTTIQFKALASNTGASTLNTPVTGATSIVNTDGSTLTAGAIQANGKVQVTYDGTRFLLSKRPFNDRIIVVGSN